MQTYNNTKYFVDYIVVDTCNNGDSFFKSLNNDKLLLGQKFPT